MELKDLVSRNFKPRDDLEKQAKELMQEEIKKIPVKGVIKAAIVDQGNSFLISMVAEAENKIFSSESHHSKDITTGFPRYWQLGALKLVLTDLIHQIRRNLKLK